MTIVALSVMLIVITILYHSSFKEVERRLLESAFSHATLIDSIARSNIEHHSFGDSEHTRRFPDPFTHTIEEVKDGLAPQHGSSEITLAKRSGDNIEFIIRQKSSRRYEPFPTSFSSPLAEPMRQALSGNTGTLVGLDYRNTKVVAAYHPIPTHNLGIVVKIDINEIRAPFISAAVISTVAAFFLILAGGLITHNISGKIINEIQKGRRRFKNIFDNTEVAIFDEDLSEIYRRLEDLKERGITDLRTHLAENEQFTWNLAASIRVRDANNAALKLFDADSFNELSDNIDKTFGHNAIGIFINELCTIWDSGDKFRSEASVRTLKGTNIDTIISFQIPKHGDDLRRIPVSIIDVTENKRNEMALRSSEHHSRMLFEESSTGLALCKMDGSLVDVNPAYANIIGRDVEETLKLSYWDITPERYAEQERKQLEQLNTSGRYGPYEKEYLHKDGSLRNVRLQGRLLNRGNEQLIWSSVEDITKQKRAEEKIRASEAKLKNLVDNLSAGIVVHAPDTSITMSNNRASELLGLTIEQMMGKTDIDPAWHFIDKDHQPLPLESYPVNLVKSSDTTLKDMLVGVNKPGHEKTVWVLVNGFPQTDENGELQEIIISFVDITDRIEAEERILVLAQAVEQSPESIAITSVEAEIEYVNEAFSVVRSRSQLRIGRRRRLSRTNRLRFAIHGGQRKQHRLPARRCDWAESTRSSLG
ncbi:PAS domain-containing protein [Solemya pervernicosa gill symbiont]|nr:PAS domain-containing protein [Solemya pervernicosa gill symbiont]